MELQSIHQRLCERDDVETVAVVETGTLYGWLNTSIGHTGDFDPGLLAVLQECAEGGHGVFIPAQPNRHAVEDADFEIRPNWRD